MARRDVEHLGVRLGLVAGPARRALATALIGFAGNGHSIAARLALAAFAVVRRSARDRLARAIGRIAPSLALAIAARPVAGILDPIPRAALGAVTVGGDRFIARRTAPRFRTLLTGAFRARPAATMLAASTAVLTAVAAAVLTPVAAFIAAAIALVALIDPQRALVALVVARAPRSIPIAATPTAAVTVPTTIGTVLTLARLGARGCGL